MSLPANIILVGFMGSGKTSTGKELSKLLHFHFLDMDQWIEEKNGKKIPEIFDLKGENYFRQQESQAIEWLAPQNKYIISTGGGAWLDGKNREKLLKIGWCVWLKVSPKEAWQRVGNRLEDRPLLSRSKNPIQEIERLLQERERFYSLTHASFDTGGKTPKAVALEIVATLKEARPFDLPKL